MSSVHSISLGLTSECWQFQYLDLLLFFFSDSYVDLPVCLESLSCCVTQFRPSLSCWTDGLTFVSGIFWYIVCLSLPQWLQASQVQWLQDKPIITPPPQRLADSMRCLWWCSVLCLVALVLCVMTKHPHFCLISQKDMHFISSTWPRIAPVNGRFTLPVVLCVVFGLKAQVTKPVQLNLCDSFETYLHPFVICGSFKLNIRYLFVFVFFSLFVATYVTVQADCIPSNSMETEKIG